MKEGWEYRKLGDVCEILDSKRKPITKSKREAGSIPYYGATGLLDYVKEYIFDEKLLLLGEDGAKWGAGEDSAYIIEGKTWVNNHAHVLKPIETSYEYLVYFLKYSDLLPFITGVTVPKLNQEKMRSIEVYLPKNISEQQRIVTYLDTSFSKIDELKENVAKELSDAKALFQAELKKCMEKKEGWGEKTLGEVCSKIGSGATPRGGKKIYISEGTSLVRSLNVHHGFFKYDDLAHIDENAAEQLKGVELKENDVLFNITGASIARCCIVPSDVLPSRVNQHVSILRIEKCITPSFLCLLLNSREHQKKLLTIGESGSTRQAITKGDLENHLIAFPSLSEQHQIVTHLDTLSQKIQELEKNYNTILAECDALKQAILRETFE